MELNKINVDPCMMDKFSSGNFKTANRKNLGCSIKKVFIYIQEKSETFQLIIQIIFKGQIRVTKDMVISSKFLHPLLLNRKFILNLKGKGKLRAKDPLIQFYHCKFTGAVME
jgi:hypothetical protein